MNFTAIAVAVALLTGLGGFIGGMKVGMDHERANQLSKQESIAEAVDAANNASAAAIAALRPVYTTLQGKVTREIETNVVYRDCKLSPDGLLLANQALAGGSKPSGSGELPKADAPAK